MINYFCRKFQYDYSAKVSRQGRKKKKKVQRGKNTVFKSNIVAMLIPAPERGEKGKIVPPIAAEPLEAWHS